MKIFLIILYTVAIVLTALNIAITIHDKNTHAALGWTCSLLFALGGLINNLP